MAEEEQEETIGEQAFREWQENEARKAARKAARIAAGKDTKPTPEQRARHQHKDRLRRLERDLRALETHLQRRHADRSGIEREMFLMRCPDDQRDRWRDAGPNRPGLASRMQQVREGATGGDPLDADFINRMTAVYDYCERMRTAAPPERAPGWSPLDALTPAQRDRVQWRRYR